MSELERIRPFYPLIKSLYKASRDKLGFGPHPTIHVSNNIDNSKNPLGKTAHYTPSDHKIVLYTTGRHIKDILRSLSHELVHHDQNCRGEFEAGAATVQGYAQEDGHLREMEREAYENGNMIFRDWEDQMKKKNGKSLFTTTSNYVRPMTTDVVGGRLVEGDKQMKLIESRLREYIKETIREMIDESLNEEEVMEAEDGLKDGIPATPTDLARPTGENPMGEEISEMCDLGPEIDAQATVDTAEHLEEGGTRDETSFRCGPPPTDKDSEEYKGWEECAERASQVQFQEESLNESFLPKGRNIRENARLMTYEKLVSKWARKGK